MFFFELTGIVFWIFWAVVFSVSLGIGWLLNKNHNILAGISIGGSLLVLKSMGIISFASIVANPWSIFPYAVYWIAIGILWSIYMWFKYLKKRLNQYNESLDMFLKENGVKELTPQLKFHWTKKLKENYELRHISSTPPEAKENKERIINWIVGWPFSILGEFISEWLFNFFSKLFNMISELYDNMAKSVYKNTSEDILSDEEYCKIVRQTRN